MIFILILLIFFILLHIYFKIKFSYWRKRGLSSIRPIWFFGTMFAENAYHSRQKEWNFYEEHGPVFGSYAGTIPMFNTSHPEHIKQVLRDTHIFHSIGQIVSMHDQFLAKSILFQNGPKWKDTRSIMSHYFTSHKLKNLMNHYETVTANFLNNIKEIRRTTKSDLVDLKALSKCFGIDMIAKVVMAIDIDSYKQKDNEFVKAANAIGTPDIVQGFLKTFLPERVSNYLGLNAMKTEPSNKLGYLFKRIIREREDNQVKYNDLIEQMQVLMKERNLNLDEDTVIGNVLLSFFAGVDTVSTNVCRIFYLLTEHPEVTKRLCTEIRAEFANEITYEKLNENAYLDAVVKECLRMENSIISLERTAMVDTKIGDFKIEKGTGVVLMTHVAQNHPDSFVEPKTFNPDRFLDKSSSNPNKLENMWIFGGGQKNCLGMRLALIEIKYLLVKVFLSYNVYQPSEFKLNELCMRRFCGLNSCSLYFSLRNDNI